MGKLNKFQKITITAIIFLAIGFIVNVITQYITHDLTIISKVLYGIAFVLQVVALFLSSSNTKKKEDNTSLNNVFKIFSAVFLVMIGAIGVIIFVSP